MVVGKAVAVDEVARVLVGATAAVGGFRASGVCGLNPNCRCTYGDLQSGLAAPVVPGGHMVVVEAVAVDEVARVLIRAPAAVQAAVVGGGAPRGPPRGPPGLVVRAPPVAAVLRLGLRQGARFREQVVEAGRALRGQILGQVLGRRVCLGGGYLRGSCALTLYHVAEVLPLARCLRRLIV